MTWRNPETWCDMETVKNCIPFVALSAARAGEKIDRPIVTRIIEACIMGGIAGALGAYGTLLVVESRVENLQTSMDKFSHEVETDRKELREDIRRLEGFHMQGVPK